MVNPQLTAYIQENLSKFSKEAVIKSLSTAGWSAIDISAAFMELEHPAPPAASAPVAPVVVAEPAQQRPIGSVESRPAVTPASAPIVGASSATQEPQTATISNDAFLAEMTKRRKEADALNPQPVPVNDVTISVGSTANPVSTQGGLVGMVLKTGLVKTEQQANMVLIGITIVCLGLSLWLIL